MTHAYYNELDIEKAAVIREAIACGLIAPGDVDTRSITEVQPEDVRGYTQCHWFAGAGVWSYALRLAGWPDSRPCWTGSCPCPSFSCAGKGEGFDDARNLWPAWHSLIRECRPRAVFGEQVAAAIGHGWLDLVCGDMEAEEYAVAAAVLGAHSAGAPHIRQRLYFCAHTGRSEQARRWHGPDSAPGSGPCGELAGCGDPGERAHADGGQSSDRDLQRSREQRLLATDRGASDALPCSESMHAERRPVMLDGRDGRDGQDDRRAETHSIAGTRGEVLGSGDPALGGLAMRGRSPGNAGHAARTSEPSVSHHTFSTRLEGRERPGQLELQRGTGTIRPTSTTGATRGFWADCDWWYGRDGRNRPIEPGVQPLAHGYPARVLALRCWGDAICAPVAAAFIESANEAISSLGAL